MLDQQLGELLKWHIGKSTFPGYHVRKMKLPATSQSGRKDGDLQLGPIERTLSTRWLLVLVPSIFLAAYGVCVWAAINQI
jgi:hypothetical protein